MNDTTARKYECLLHEHDVLSRYVEQEVVATALARTTAAAAWVIGMAVAAAADLSAWQIVLLAFPALGAAWFVDVYFSYVGVVYKVRRFEVRRMLAEVFAADEPDVAGWRTPVNPFDDADKKSAFIDALKSPWVLLPYLVLEAATLCLAFCAA